MRSLRCLSLLAIVAACATPVSAGVAVLSGPSTARVNEPVLISTAGTDGTPKISLSQNSLNAPGELTVLYRRVGEEIVAHGVELLARGPGRFEIVAWPEGEGEATPDVHVVTVADPSPPPNPGPSPPPPGPGPEPPPPNPPPGPNLSENSRKVRDAARPLGPATAKWLSEQLFRRLVNEINADVSKDAKYWGETRFKALMEWAVGQNRQVASLGPTLHAVMTGASTVPEIRTRFFEIAEGLEAVQ